MICPCRIVPNKPPSISNYEKHYLFREGYECCSKYFPGASDCPFEDETQQDYYWTNYQNDNNNLDDMPVKYNHTYYPDLNAGTCVNGYALAAYH